MRFTRGDLPEEILERESKALAAESVETKPRLGIDQLERDMPRARALIRSWIAQAEEDDFDVLLRAVNAEITASTGEVKARGAVPLIAELPQPFATIERHRHHRSEVTKSTGCRFASW